MPRAKVVKINQSFYLNVPAEAARALHLRAGQVVEYEVHPIGERIEDIVRDLGGTQKGPAKRIADPDLWVRIGAERRWPNRRRRSSDTSAWIALLTDEHAAARVGELVGDLRAVTTPIVLAELAAHHAMGRLRGADPIPEIEGRARVEAVTRDDALSAAATYARMRKDPRSRLGLADALIYATARRVGAVLVTLDSDLKGEPGVVFVGKGGKA